MKKQDLINGMKAKREQYKIPGLDYEITLRSLTLNELAEYAIFTENKDTKGAIEYTLFSMLRENFPTKETDIENGFTDDEIHNLVKDLDGKIVNGIITTIQKLSGLGDAETDEKNPSGVQEAQKELQN